MMKLSRDVLIVDDEFLVAEGLTYQIEELGLTVCATAATADDAVALALAHLPGLVLMDMRLHGERDGVDAALAIHEQLGAKVIFITGSKEPSTLERIAGDHPSAILFKPVSDHQLRNAVGEALGL